MKLFIFISQTGVIFRLPSFSVIAKSVAMKQSRGGVAGLLRCFAPRKEDYSCHFRLFIWKIFPLPMTIIFVYPGNIPPRKEPAKAEKPVSSRKFRQIKMRRPFFETLSFPLTRQKSLNLRLCENKQRNY
jgi:hypothetical protein